MSDPYRLTAEEVQKLLRSLESYVHVLDELMDEFGDMKPETTLLEAKNWFLRKIARLERKSGQKLEN